MKAILLAIFSLLIASSYSIGASQRLGAQISIHSLHLEKISTLGSALKGLIQLADSNDFDPVIEIISDVSAEFSANLAAQQQGLAVLTQNAQDNIAQAEASIEAISGAIVDANNALTVLQTAQAQLEEAIEANVNAISAATEASSNERERRQEAQDAAEQHVNNINDALEVIQEVTRVLEEIRSQDEGIAASFIQTQKKKFVKNLALAHKKLSKTKLKLSNTNLYIKQLVQITQDLEEDGTIDDELLDQIFVLLETFKEFLTEEGQQAQENDEADAESSQNTLTLLGGVIDSQKQSLSDNQAALGNVEDSIATAQGNISSLEESLEGAQENLNQIQADFAEQSQIAQTLISKLEVDVDVLQRALVFVQSQAAGVESSNADSGNESVTLDGGSGVGAPEFLGSASSVEEVAPGFVGGSEGLPPQPDFVYESAETVSVSAGASAPESESDEEPEVAGEPANQSFEVADNAQESESEPEPAPPVAVEEEEPAAQPAAASEDESSEEEEEQVAAPVEAGSDEESEEVAAGSESASEQEASSEEEESENNSDE